MSDMTCRFVVVELCIHECVHVKQRAEQRAHAFFCLAKCELPPKHALH